MSCQISDKKGEINKLEYLDIVKFRGSLSKWEFNEFAENKKGKQKNIEGENYIL